MLTLAQADSYQKEAQKQIAATSSKAQLLRAQSQFIGKKSALQNTIAAIATLSPADKRTHGAIWHKILHAIEAACEAQHRLLDACTLDQNLRANAIDYTLPVEQATGGLHPVTKTKERIEAIFAKVGFLVESGLDIETEYYNFTALNIPLHHSARAMHDTFYFNNDVLLRTHTSPVQIHILENQAPPIHIICSGRVYRCDSDATHTPMFHQVEGLVVEVAGRVSFAHLKGLLTDFLRAFFALELPVRFRPSYFPFTEPSVEVDMGCVLCKQKGCRVCGHTGWLEVLGAGMVHPNVLQGAGLDPEAYQGLAFGLGVERFCMLYYGIDDIRTLYDNNIHLLQQFHAC